MFARLLIAGLAAWVGFASPQAHAADLAPSPQGWGTPSRVAAAWQGFYVGLHAGYSWARYDATLTPGSVPFSFETSGLSGGLFTGFNYQVAPQFVIGAEADVTLWDPNQTRMLTGQAFQADSDWQSTIRGRFGFTFDALMVYGTLGLALANTDFTGPAGGTERVRVGWALGAGIEARLTEQVFARAEYLYTAYGADNYALGATQRMDSDLDSHTLRVGGGVRF